jgi:hypothetical protein
MHKLLLLSSLALPFGLSLAGESAPQDPRQALAEALGEQGVHLDLDDGLASVRAKVLVRGDLLEYLLIETGGAGHESLFVTEARPSVINTALMTLGVEPGQNAVWTMVEPEPTLEERRAGKKRWTIAPPTGDGFYLYAGWREAGETYFFRVDDLLSNLLTGRSMQRHRWVFLGSRFASIAEGEPEVFLADFEHNVVNISFFREGNTLLTGALQECEEQSIWVANGWLLPDTGSEVEFVFSRERLSHPPAALLARLPDVGSVATVEVPGVKDG